MPVVIERHIVGDEASQLAERAMQSPGAHFYIALIAAAAFELNGDATAATRWRDHALRHRPDASVPMFFAAFPFRDQGARSKISGALTRLGLP